MLIYLPSQRTESYLEKLNSSSHTVGSASQPVLQKFDFGDRSTFAVKPPTERMVFSLAKSYHFTFVHFSQVLSRVQAFLPQLEASNAILARRAQEDPDSVDIEHISDRMDQYIEMVSLYIYILLTRSNLTYYRTLVLAYSKIVPIRMLSAATTLKCQFPLRLIHLTSRKCTTIPTQTWILMHHPRS